MKILITLLKPFSFAPAILLMILIYSFSAQTGDISGNLSYQISYTIVETKNEVLNEGKGYEELAYEHLLYTMVFRMVSKKYRNG